MCDPFFEMNKMTSPPEMRIPRDLINGTFTLEKWLEGLDIKIGEMVDPEGKILRF